MPSFSPPAVRDVPPLARNGVPLSWRLFRYYDDRLRGRSVICVGGVYQTVDNPSQDLLDTATEIYLGGHTYQVDSATAAALTAAGYTVTGPGTWASYDGRTWAGTPVSWEAA